MPPRAEGEGALWWLTKDGDTDCLALYERHYSARDGRRIPQFVGPGEHIVLRTWRADAMFVWRKFIDDSGNDGVNCAVFRNESGLLSSELIRQADAVADCAWADRRHYTHVNPQKVRSSNPGFCFLAAGWRRCGMTKSGLLTLERIMDLTPPMDTAKVMRKDDEECQHDWEWVSWMGDPNVITQDLSRWECSKCGAQSNRARNDPPA